jgi:hypothetical protein
MRTSRVIWKKEDCCPRKEEEMTWQPASIQAVASIVERDLKGLVEQQLDVFRRFSVEPYRAPISRYGEIESVVVVARHGEKVIYWDDVEEGFDVAMIDDAGRIVPSSASQDPLAVAINRWIAQ